ncbi:hypothetical protein AR689_07485 [Arthrobacter sp. EpRS71]|nr:hypothetical protein AR689_07485 [Arthrobacter sp. EpRS71]
MSLVSDIYDPFWRVLTLPYYCIESLRQFDDSVFLVIEVCFGVYFEISHALLDRVIRSIKREVANQFVIVPSCFTAKQGYFVVVHELFNQS